MLGHSAPREHRQQAEDSRPLLGQSDEGNVIFSVGGDDGEEYDEREASALDSQRPIPEEQTVALPLRSTMQSRETGT